MLLYSQANYKLEADLKASLYLAAHEYASIDGMPIRRKRHRKEQQGDGQNGTPGSERNGQRSGSANSVEIMACTRVMERLRSAPKHQHMQLACDEIFQTLIEHELKICPDAAQALRSAKEECSKEFKQSDSVFQKKTSTDVPVEAQSHWRLFLEQQKSALQNKLTILVREAEDLEVLYKDIDDLRNMAEINTCGLSENATEHLADVHSGPNDTRPDSHLLDRLKACALTLLSQIWSMRLGPCTIVIK